MNKRFRVRMKTQNWIPNPTAFSAVEKVYFDILLDRGLPISDPASYMTVELDADGNAYSQVDGGAKWGRHVIKSDI